MCCYQYYWMVYLWLGNQFRVKFRTTVWSAKEELYIYVEHFFAKCNSTSFSHLHLQTIFKTYESHFRYLVKIRMHRMHYILPKMLLPHSIVMKQAISSSLTLCMNRFSFPKKTGCCVVRNCQFGEQIFQEIRARFQLHNLN